MDPKPTLNHLLLLLYNNIIYILYKSYTNTITTSIETIWTLHACASSCILQVQEVYVVHCIHLKYHTEPTPLHVSTCCYSVKGGRQKTWTNLWNHGKITRVHQEIDENHPDMPMGKLAKTKMFQIPCKFAIYLRDFGSKMQQITRKTGLDCKTKKYHPPKKQKIITHCWLQRARRTPKEFWHLRSNQVAGYIKTPAETFGDPDSLRLVRFVRWKTCSYATISSCGDCLKDHD